MFRTSAMVLMLAFGALVGTVAIIAIFNGIAMAEHIDSTQCVEIIIDSTSINQSSDGFAGIRTRFFINIYNGKEYELLTATNITTVNMWKSLKRGDAIRIRRDGNYYVPCDYPNILPYSTRV